MHWRKSETLERADPHGAVVVLRAQSQLKQQDFTREALADLLRSALVFGVSALDRYVHERVVRTVVKALRSPKLSSAQKELVLPVSTTLRVIRGALKKRKQPKQIRPANLIRHELQELLHRKPFQSWREIEYAFDLIGLKPAAAVQKHFAVGNLKVVKDQLGAIARRRNLIVHEGDLERRLRGGTAKKHVLDRRYVEDSLIFLDKLVGGLESVT